MSRLPRAHTLNTALSKSFWDGLVMLLVLILVFAVTFTLLYIAGLSTLHAANPTFPVLSEEEAAMIVEDYLKKRVLGFEGYGIYVNGSGYKPYNGSSNMNITIPLFLVHQNRTVQELDQSSLTYGPLCTVSAETQCGLSQEVLEQSVERLVYLFDVTILSKDDDCSFPDFIVVDAMNGEVVFSFIDHHPKTIIEQCILPR